MTTLHVIYRVDDEGTPDELWTTYSFPEGIYVSGDTLRRARLAFHQAALLHFDEFATLDVTEHIERPVVDDIYVRVAVDRHSLDRDIAAVGVCTAGPSVPGQGTFVAWIPLLREGAARQPAPPGSPEIESLSAGGLGLESTVGELLTAKFAHGERPVPMLVGSTAA